MNVCEKSFLCILGHAGVWIYLFLNFVTNHYRFLDFKQRNPRLTSFLFVFFPIYDYFWCTCAFIASLSSPNIPILPSKSSTSFVDITFIESWFLTRDSIQWFEALSTYQSLSKIWERCKIIYNNNFLVFFFIILNYLFSSTSSFNKKFWQSKSWRTSIWTWNGFTRQRRINKTIRT